MNRLRFGGRKTLVVLGITAAGAFTVGQVNPDSMVARMATGVARAARIDVDDVQIVDVETHSRAQRDDQDVWSWMTDRRAPDRMEQLSAKGYGFVLPGGERVAWLEAESALRAEHLVAHHLQAPQADEWTLIEIRDNEVVVIRGRLSSPSHGVAIAQALWNVARTAKPSSDIIIRSPRGEQAFYSASGRFSGELERLFDYYRQNFGRDYDRSEERIDTREDNGLLVRIKRWSESDRSTFDAAFGHREKALEKVIELRDDMYNG